MNRCRKTGLLVSAVFTALFLTCAAIPAHSEVNVNINIGPPAVVFHEPPELIVVPRTMVYFAPAVEVEIFFYRGNWWRSHEGRWYRAKGYDGPWTHIGRRHVPADIVRLPRDYRTVYVREQRVPYGQLKKHWEHREHEKRRGRGEWKKDKREHKGEGKGHKGRGRDD